jgi:hypothetical protein
MKKALILISFWLPLLALAQLTDDFSDGDLLNNPTWLGNSSSFIVNANNQLQLDESGSGTKFLSTVNTQMLDTEWNFWLKLDFNPSASNQLKIYLVSDQENLDQSLNGYFIQIGENLALDGIDLYKQSGTTETLLIDGMDAHAATKPEIRIKVLHKKDGYWELYSDLSGGKNFSLEGSIIDSSFKSTSYFGILCQYTSSNADHFFFDDFYIGAEQVDTSGPQITRVEVLSRSKLEIEFNETLLADSVLTSKLGILSSPDATYYEATFVSQPQPSSLVVDFSPNTFEGSTNYLLQTKDLYDLLGNKNSESFPFQYFGLSYHDIVFNELMPDPTPGNQLPEAEFIELYNMTKQRINLEGFTIADPSKESTLPAFILESDDYVILCNTDDTALFSPYGEVISISLPSLNNSSDILSLKDKYGSLVDSLGYSDNWYKDDVKKEGGWSLELINPLENCLFDEYNWTSSVDKKGGTPGKENSVFDLTYGFQPPRIQSFAIVADSIIQIISNKKLKNIDDISFSSLHIESKTKPSEQISFVEKSQPELHIYKLSCNKRFEKNSVYKLQIDSLLDCNQKLSSLDTLLAIPIQADSADIIINEILFNPHPGSYDFVELYNRSKNIIDLKDLKIASFDDSMNIKYAYPISDVSKILYPEEYIVLTEKPSDIESQYLCKYPDRLFEAKLPGYSDDEGRVVILDQNNQLIDYFYYSEKMHFALLDNEEGVSLERLSFDEKTNNASNWHSAASSYGYGTPTYQNSQYSESEVSEREFWLDPDVFSPDGDGYNDLLIINYAFNNATNFGRIRIFDIAGRLVKELVSNDLMGMEGFYSWDGTNDHAELSPTGVYIVVAEINNLDGTTRKYKRSCTLAKYH